MLQGSTTPRAEGVTWTWMRSDSMGLFDLSNESGAFATTDSEAEMPLRPSEGVTHS